MSKEIDFSLYVHISGCVEVDSYDGDPNELLDAIFPDGWVGEVGDVFVDTMFMPKGYIDVIDLEDEDEDEDDEEQEA